MKFRLMTNRPEQKAYLEKFLLFVGKVRWQRRIAQLIDEAEQSPALAKIVEDYHWLELAIDELLKSSVISPEFPAPQGLESIAALDFIGMLVECYRRVGSAGRTALEGRVRAALQAETGFAALYLEMDMGRRLLNADFDIRFPDLEGFGQYDLAFANPDLVGEVECKTMSADAGRKIHRKEFYRYMNAVEADLAHRAEAGGDDILLITLDDRLPAAAAQQTELRTATAHLTHETTLAHVEGSFFTIQRESYSAKLGSSQHSTQKEFYNACCVAFGKNCHVSGVVGDRGVSLVVMRSSREDDTSKPWLLATEKAATQFSGSRPAFIAMQFNDIEPADLVSSHLRRRAEILSAALYARGDTTHVVGVLFCPYRGLVGMAGHVGAPAFSVLNPRAKFLINPATCAPFLDHISDEKFARMVLV